MDIDFLKEKANYYSQKYWNRNFEGNIEIDKSIKEKGVCKYPLGIKINPKPGIVQISITPTDQILNTLLHELCHHFLYKQGIDHDHRHKVWKDTLNMVEETQTINRVLVILGQKDNWSIKENLMIYLDEIEGFKIEGQKKVITLSNRKTNKKIEGKFDTVVLSPKKCFVGDDYIEEVKRTNKNFVKKNKSYFSNEYMRNLNFFNQYYKFDKHFEEILQNNREQFEIKIFSEML